MSTIEGLKFLSNSNISFRQNSQQHNLTNHTINSDTEKDIFTRNIEEISVELPVLNGPYGHPYTGRSIIGNSSKTPEKKPFMDSIKDFLGIQDKNNIDTTENILKDFNGDKEELLNVIDALENAGVEMETVKTVLETSLLQETVGDGLTEELTQELGSELTEQICSDTESKKILLDNMSDIFKNIFNLG